MKTNTFMTKRRNPLFEKQKPGNVWHLGLKVQYVRIPLFKILNSTQIISRM